MNIKIIKPVIANVDGVSVRFLEGEEVNVSKDVAENLKAGGYAVGIRTAAKVQVQPKGKPLNTKNVKGE